MGENRYLDFWYIDEEAIGRIWNQKDKPTLTTVVNEVTSKAKTKEGINVGIPSLLSLTTSFSDEELMKELLKQNYEMTVEQEVLELLSELKAENACDVLKPNERTRLVYCKGYFLLWELYLKKKPLENILGGKWDKSLPAFKLDWHFKFLPSYNPPVGFSSKRNSIQILKDYEVDLIDFSKEEYDVDMYADGKKVCVNLRHLTNRIEGRIPFYFHVLGQVDYICDNKYQIKPLAICR